MAIHPRQFHLLKYESCSLAICLPVILEGSERLTCPREHCHRMERIAQDRDLRPFASDDLLYESLADRDLAITVTHLVHDPHQDPTVASRVLCEVDPVGRAVDSNEHRNVTAGCSTPLLPHHFSWDYDTG